MTDTQTVDASRHGRDSKMVLVVDDDPAQCREIADYLRHKGIRVLEIGDGALALREIERLKPALVLMDYMLPGCDGVRASAIAQVLSPETTIVLMSGQAEEARHANAVLTHPVPVLQKPLTLSQIANFAAHVLGRAGIPSRPAGAAN